VSIQEHIHRDVTIHAGTAKVWAALTRPELMKQWMTETEIEIITDWVVGQPIVIRGPWYKTQFENKGTVLGYDEGRAVSYSHLSSLSRLPDMPESYTIFSFTLHEIPGGTQLDLELSNFPTEAIYHHIAYYWTIALGLLKKFVESS
jgi:uncharacterized protein YndB with AHSA1/START domain